MTDDIILDKAFLKAAAKLNLDLEQDEFGNYKNYMTNMRFDIFKQGYLSATNKPAGKAEVKEKSNFTSKPPHEASEGKESMKEVVAEYLHWRKVNPHIKGGDNYLKRLEAAMRAPDGDVNDTNGAEINKNAIIQALDTAGDGWLPIDTAPNGQTVLVFYRNVCGKARVIKAEYYPKHFLPASDMNYEAEDADYCEEKDEYYTPQGWYELIDNWDDYSHIRADISPTHWQPLPNPPAESAKENI